MRLTTRIHLVALLGLLGGLCVLVHAGVAGSSLPQQSRQPQQTQKPQQPSKGQPPAAITDVKYEVLEAGRDVKDVGDLVGGLIQAGANKLTPVLGGDSTPRNGGDGAPQGYGSSSSGSGGSSSGSNHGL